MKLDLSAQPARGRGRSGRYPVTPWSSQRLFRPFVRVALISSLVLGFATGGGMLIAAAFDVERGLWWVTHAQAHGMAQIFGFAGLFTMGIAFHVVPRFRNGSINFPWPQRATLWLILLAVVFRFAGQSVNGYPATGILVGLSAALLMTGALVFAPTIYPVLLGGRNPLGPAERWIHAALVWLVVSAGFHLALATWMIQHESAVAPAYLESAVIYSGMFGFVGSFIMGVSNRAVTGFLGLKPVHARFELASFYLLHAGLAIAVFAFGFQLSDELRSIGLLLLAAGIVTFVYAVRVLEPSGTRRPPVSPGAYMRFGWFIRSAYGWLIVGSTFMAIEATETLSDVDILPAQDSLPVLHVITMGFITSMIIGMGSRMVPLFEGSVVPQRRLLDVAFVLLVASVITRTTGGFAGQDASGPLLGISGGAGLIAVILAFWPILRSTSRKAREDYRVLAEEHGRVTLELSRGRDQSGI